MKETNDVIAYLSKGIPEDRALIEKALNFAEEAHKEELRYSGEPYITHSIETAKNLADLKMDATVIAAGLLHDVLDQNIISLEKLEKEFGPEIAFLVEGAHKLGKLKYMGDDRRAENLRKLFVAMAKDIRVLIVKLAGRLHNISTLEHVPTEKQKRVALETLEIYAPLANRLGMGKLKDALEEKAFVFAYPEEHAKVKNLLSQKAGETKEYLEKIYRSIQKELAKNNFLSAKVEYRAKQIYSLYKKLLRHDMDINKIHDLYAIRIIVPNLNDCYQALGLIHGAWTPVPGKIKDYIALPKPNGYQSIHTSIFTGDGKIVEIQIRTEEMHKEAEYGIASHIAYSEAGKPRSGGILTKKLAWVKQLLDWQKNIAEGTRSEEFLENLKMDFFQYRVFTFTPKGDVIDLPENATPIDFAYAIHSEIGDHAFGAKVNAKMVPLHSSLKNGDIVEILTKKNSKPSSKWLDFVKTAAAKKNIRTHLELSK